MILYKRAALAVIAVLLAGRLLLGPFREGWSQMRTDFPNHYVAAKLALRHEPLRQFYDWEWFQREIQLSGIEGQLGGYIPYPPLAMLPYLPLAELPPQQAKQVWLIAQVIFLGVSIWLLSRCTKLSILETSVLALLAYTSLATNFTLGHTYIFLLLLLSAAVFALLRGRDFLGGVLLGLIFSLKLYAAPFALFFLVRRQWRALWGMAASVAALGLLTIAWFGWDAVAFYATSVMTRGLDGAIVDPYNPGLGSMAVLLRRLFVPEGELNPHPLINAPAAFFFLQAFYSLGLLVAALLTLPKRSQADDAAVAWFILVLFALSPVTAYSHFVLLLVPVVVLVSRAPRVRACGFGRAVCAGSVAHAPLECGVVSEAMVLTRAGDVCRLVISVQSPSKACAHRSGAGSRHFRDDCMEAIGILPHRASADRRARYFATRPAARVRADDRRNWGNLRVHGGAAFWTPHGSETIQFRRRGFSPQRSKSRGSLLLRTRFSWPFPDCRPGTDGRNPERCPHSCERAEGTRHFAGRFNARIYLQRLTVCRRCLAGS